MERSPGGGGAPDLSIIIVTWNVRELTLRCLESVFGGAGGLALEVFVVDNASTDGTPAAVAESFPRVELIRNRRNEGFPRANNQALERVRGRHVLFLNPDTEVGEGTLPACVAELDRDPQVGMVGPRLVYPDGTVQFEGGRNPYLLRHLLSELLYLHMFFPRSRVFAHHLMGYWDHLDRRDVEALCGAFMMVRRELALEVGGLPEDLFMYHEDLSFCLRIRRRGWRIRYLGDVTTLHHTNQSSRKSHAPLDLLEGEVKLRLIREGQGRMAAGIGRLVFAARSLLRLAIAAPAGLVPGLGRWKQRYPRVFNTRFHYIQLIWSLSPRLARWITRDEQVPWPERLSPNGTIRETTGG